MTYLKVYKSLVNVVKWWFVSYLISLHEKTTVRQMLVQVWDKITGRQKVVKIFQISPFTIGGDSLSNYSELSEHFSSENPPPPPTIIKGWFWKLWKIFDKVGQGPPFPRRKRNFGRKLNLVKHFQSFPTMGDVKSEILFSVVPLGHMKTGMPDFNHPPPPKWWLTWLQ